MVNGIQIVRTTGFADVPDPTGVTQFAKAYFHESIKDSSAKLPDVIPVANPTVSTSENGMIRWQVRDDDHIQAYVAAEIERLKAEEILNGKQ